MPNFLISILIPWLFITISVCYLIFFLLISFAFFRGNKEQKLANQPGTLVSVIIAARNEELSLPGILSDLKHQDFPTELFNIILVDDHSQIKISSLKSIQNLNMKNLMIIDMPDSVTGKKAALRLAAERSASELLLFTDADCRVGPEWIRSYNSNYENQHPEFLFGLVDYQNVSGFLQNFFRYDFLSLVVTGAGTALLGFPTICNGANMAVSRKSYIKVAGEINTRSPSGDDVFALHQAKKIKNFIMPVKRKSAIAYTRAPVNLREFFNQRARWTSKAIYYKDPATITLSFLVVLTNFLFAYSFIALIRNGIYLPYALFLVNKIIADYVVIIVGLSYFRDWRSISLLPFFQLIYPVYLFSTLLLGVFGTFRWKGRSY